MKTVFLSALALAAIVLCSCLSRTGTLQVFDTTERPIDGSDCPPFLGGAACETCVVYVDPSVTGGDGSSWSSAMATLQPAIDAAALSGSVGTDGCEVWVAAATYHIYDSSTTDTIVLRSNVTLYGGFAGGEQTRDERDFAMRPTILAADAGDGDDNHRVAHVLIATTLDGAPAPINSGVDGFTITGARALAAPGDAGAGMVLADGARVRVANCRWVDNRAASSGAIAVDFSELEVDSCVFENNAAVSGAGGAIGVWQSEIAVRSSSFIANVASTEGGAINAITPSPLSLVDVTLTRNSAESGGALWIESGSATISASKLIENASTHAGGGLFVSGATLTLVSTTLVSNRASYGGGIYSLSDLTMTDCQVATNTASTWGGGLVQADGSLTLLDTTVTGNESVLGGGLYGEGAETTLRIERGVFASNEASDFGSAIQTVTAGLALTVINTLLAGNDAVGVGGALSVSGGILALEASTLADNTSGQDGSALSMDDGATATVENSVFYGNKQPQAYAAPLAAVSVTYSALPTGACSGTCSTDATVLAVDPSFRVADLAFGTFASAVYDPISGSTVFTDDAATWEPNALVGLFVRPSSTLRAGLRLPIAANTQNTLTVVGDVESMASVGSTYATYDYHLSPASPCLGQGTTGSSAPEDDIEGNTRGTSFNMGAYQNVRP